MIEPVNIDLLIETKRLVIEPVTQSHAEQMVDVLGDPVLYQYIPFDPPTLEKLQQRYKRWEVRISPQQDEIWLNWVVRLKGSNLYIGDVQAGYKDDKIASIAYMTAKKYQHFGYTHEGLGAVIAFLFEQLHVSAVKAWIDTRNQRSIHLVKKLGLQYVETITNADYFKGANSNEFVFELIRNNSPHSVT